MKRILIALSMLVAVSFPANAGQLTLELPAVAGTGCPPGSTSAVLSPDQMTLSILFSAFQASAGAGTGRTFDRQTCNVAIPVNVPQGISLSLIGVDYRGFTLIPTGAFAQFRVEYFFAGSPGPVFARNFFAPQASNYLIQNNLLAAAIVWSPCGAQVILRTNASMLVSSGGDFALATVDTQDVTAGIIWHLQTRPCF